MSSVHYMEKLLDGVTVEWKSLGDVLLPKGYIRGPFGSALKKEFFVTEGVPVYEQQHAIYDKRDFRYFIDNDRAENLKRFTVKPNDLIISCSGTIGKISIITEHDKIGVINQALLILRLDLSKVSVKYIKYYFDCFTKLLVTSSGGAITNIEKRDVIEKIPIPIPPLAIQAEIVRILDTFTALTTELTAELTARKKQYNYYRDQLLTFAEGEVEWKALGEVGEILRGTAITEKETNPGEFPVVGNGPSHNYYHNKSNRSGETIVIARSGVYAGLVSYWNKPIFLTDAFSIHPENKVLSTKFLYYVLKKDQIKIHLMGQGAGVPHVRAKDFESYKVPIPPLAEQARIVSILDKFDALTNSISEGLPREIELRQQQYEYYREQLLSFPKVAGEA